MNLLGIWTQLYFDLVLFKLLETHVETFLIWRSDTRMCFSVSGFLQTQDRYSAEYLKDKLFDKLLAAWEMTSRLIQ
jgi:hypothetical protein